MFRKANLPLPMTSYASLVVAKPKEMHVIWRREGVAEDFLYEETFALPGNGDSHGHFDASIRKELYSDRYGGFGVGYCGGSGRCAGDEKVQLKGVGITPLWRANPKIPNDRWHSNGIVDAVEAAREIIWTEICSQILPYGAVPILGAVAIGADSRAPLSDTRVVLIRSNCFRPAHFMRNVLFEPAFQCGQHLDVTRVVNALKLLPEIFDATFRLQLAGNRPAKRLGNGLLELSRRLSCQLATAFVRRLFHGAPLCSNISLDGKLLDFGATTYVPGYRREAAEPFGIDQWNQRQILTRSLLKFHENIVEFSGLGITEDFPTSECIKAEIGFAWERTLAKEFFRLAGLNSTHISEKLLRRHSSFIECCIGLMKAAAKTQYVLRNRKDDVMRNASSLGFGESNLNSALVRLSNDDGVGEKVKALHVDLGVCREIAEKLVSSHSALIVEAASGRFSPPEPSARTYAKAIQRNQELPFLKRHILDNRFSSLEGGRQEYSAEIQKIIATALTALKTND
ncbi:hypothetical protein [Asticcacaulis sp.]|uniref:hypothetical protein n=1 Tax=Asticcacaulis sp. TaxID=1872648 RepID=UPI00261E9239|nr:hypothetical protein [Asticcacaulis sp.]